MRKKSLEESNENKSAEHYYAQGRKHYQNKCYNEAITSLEMAINKEPKYDTAYHYLAHVLFKAGNIEKSIESLNKAISINPQKSDYWQYLGSNYKAMGNFSQAIQCYTKATEIKPINPRHWKCLGDSYYAIQNYGKAIKCYEQELAIHACPSKWNQLGIIYSEIDNEAQAAICFKESIKLAPNEAVYHYNAGNAYLDMEQNNESIPYFLESIRLDPKEPCYRNKLAHAYIYLEDYTTAITSLNNAVIEEAFNDATFKLLHYSVRSLSQQVKKRKAPDIQNDSEYSSSPGNIAPLFNTTEINNPSWTLRVQQTGTIQNKKQKLDK